MTGPLGPGLTKQCFPALGSRHGGEAPHPERPRAQLEVFHGIRHAGAAHEQGGHSMSIYRWTATRLALGALAAALFPRPVPAAPAMAAATMASSVAFEALKRRPRARPGLRGHKYRI